MGPPGPPPPAPGPRGAPGPAPAPPAPTPPTHHTGRPLPMLPAPSSPGPAWGARGGQDGRGAGGGREGREEKGKGQRQGMDGVLAGFWGAGWDGERGPPRDGQLATGGCDAQGRGEDAGWGCRAARAPAAGEAREEAEGGTPRCQPTGRGLRGCGGEGRREGRGCGAGSGSRGARPGLGWVPMRALAGWLGPGAPLAAREEEAAPRPPPRLAPPNLRSTSAAVLRRRRETQDWISSLPNPGLDFLEQGQPQPQLNPPYPVGEPQGSRAPLLDGADGDQTQRPRRAIAGIAWSILGRLKWDIGEQTFPPPQIFYPRPLVSPNPQVGGCASCKEDQLPCPPLTPHDSHMKR